MRTLRTTSAAVCLLLLTSACADRPEPDVPVEIDPVEDAADEAPAADDVRDEDPAGTPDGNDAADEHRVPDSDDLDAELPDVTVDVDEVREQARDLIGEPLDAVDESSSIRIGRVGDDAYMLTMDYVHGRITVELDDDGSGTFRVVEAVAELPGGPETFR